MRLNFKASHHVCNC